MVAIIDAKEAAEASPDILVTHRIHHSKSADLRGGVPEGEHEQSPETSKKSDSGTSDKQETENEEDDFEDDPNHSEVYHRRKSNT